MGGVCEAAAKLTSPLEIGDTKRKVSIGADRVGSRGPCLLEVGMPMRSMKAGLPDAGHLWRGLHASAASPPIKTGLHWPLETQPLAGPNGRAAGRLKRSI